LFMIFPLMWSPGCLAGGLPGKAFVKEPHL